MRRIPLYISILLFVLGCSQNKTSSVEETNGKKAEVSDESLEEIRSFVENLDGITFYFMQLSGEDETEFIAKYDRLMDEMGDQVSDEIRDFLEGQQFNPYPYSIMVLDTTHNYLELECMDCKDSKYFKAWDKDGEFLIAQIDRECKPDCKDELSFYSYRAGELSSLKTEEIMKPVTIEDFFIDPEGHAAEELSEFPVEMSFRLPREGKNIMVELTGGTSPNTYKGTRLELIWKEGKFERGEFDE